LQKAAAAVVVPQLVGKSSKRCLTRASPNAFTISLFKDGKRACEPQPLPESLHGKVLFPTINYRRPTGGRGRMGDGDRKGLGF